MLEAADHGDLVKRHRPLPQQPHGVIQPHPPGEGKRRHPVYDLEHPGEVAGRKSGDAGQVVNTMVKLWMAFQMKAAHLQPCHQPCALRERSPRAAQRLGGDIALEIGHQQQQRTQIVAQRNAAVRHQVESAPET